MVLFLCRRSAELDLEDADAAVCCCKQRDEFGCSQISDAHRWSGRQRLDLPNLLFMWSC
jgi:hypothetical protein